MKRSLDKPEGFANDQVKKSKFNGTFKLQPTNRFESATFPYFRQPKEVGCFSQDSSRSFKHDRSSLRYLWLPNSSDVSFPIWEGFNTFISRDESVKEYIDHLLHWIMINKNIFKVKDQQVECSASEVKGSNANSAAGDSIEQENSIPNLNTDFVCWRGLLTKLLCTPFENREGWKIACSNFNGTIYMCEFDTEERKQQKQIQTEIQRKMTYGGWKFEQYLCAEKSGSVPDTSKPVNNSEAFCSVVRSRLKQHSLVYGGEVDCIEGDHYVELKTSRQIYNQRQDESFKRFKLLKWWAQSFLVGIPKIVCGFRNDEGIVEQLHSFNTLEIPKLCKNIRNTWDANIGFNFLDTFLTHLKRTVTEDNARLVYLFEWKPGSDIECMKQDIDSEYTFLPAWYWGG